MLTWLQRQWPRHVPGFNSEGNLPPGRPVRRTTCAPVCVCQVQRLLIANLVPSNDETLFRGRLQSAEETLGGLPCGLRCQGP